MSTRLPPGDFNRRVGGLVRENRLAADVSQQSLAEAVGLSRTSIVNIEAGKQGVTLETLLALAYALDVPFVALVPAVLRGESKRDDVDIPALRKRLRELERFRDRVTAAVRVANGGGE